MSQRMRVSDLTFKILSQRAEAHGVTVQSYLDTLVQEDLEQDPIEAEPESELEKRLRSLEEWRGRLEARSLKLR